LADNLTPIGARWSGSRLQAGAFLEFFTRSSVDCVTMAAADPLLKCPTGVREKSPILDSIEVRIPYQGEDSVSVVVDPVIDSAQDPVGSVYQATELTPDSGAAPGNGDIGAWVGWDSIQEAELLADLLSAAQDIKVDQNAVMASVRSEMVKIVDGALAEINAIKSILAKWRSATMKTDGIPLSLGLSKSTDFIRSRVTPITSNNVSEAYAIFGKLGLNKTSAWDLPKSPSNFWAAMLEARRIDRNRIRDLYVRALKGIQCAAYISAASESYLANKAAFESRPVLEGTLVLPPIKAELVPGLILSGLGGLPPGIPPLESGLLDDVPPPPPPPPPPPSKPKTSTKKSGLSGMEMAGIALGGGLLVGAAVFLFRQKSSKKSFAPTTR